MQILLLYHKKEKAYSEQIRQMLLEQGFEAIDYSMNFQSKGGYLFIFILISEGLLRSERNLKSFQRVSVWNDTIDKIFYVLLPNSNLEEYRKASSYIRFWDKKIEELVREIENYKNSEPIESLKKRLTLARQARTNVDRIIDIAIDDDTIWDWENVDAINEVISTIKDISNYVDDSIDQFIIDKGLIDEEGNDAGSSVSDIGVEFKYKILVLCKSEIYSDFVKEILSVFEKLDLFPIIQNYESLSELPLEIREEDNFVLLVNNKDKVYDQIDLKDYFKDSALNAMIYHGESGKWIDKKLIPGMLSTKFWEKIFVVEDFSKLPQILLNFDK